MASTAVTASRRREAICDPVLLLPVVVAVGLAIGWLGVHERVSGTRIAGDLALSWALVAASLVALERPRWRQARLLLVATAFALLSADLEWASSHPLWMLGFVLEGLWAAFLIQLVLTFPEGRPWSRLARVTIVGAYAVTLGGQLAEDCRGLKEKLAPPGGEDVEHEVSPAAAECLSCLEEMGPLCGGVERSV